MEEATIFSQHIIKLSEMMEHRHGYIIDKLTSIIEKMQYENRTLIDELSKERARYDELAKQYDKMLNFEKSCKNRATSNYED